MSSQSDLSHNPKNPNYTSVLLRANSPCLTVINCWMTDEIWVHVCMYGRTDGSYTKAASNVWLWQWRLQYFHSCFQLIDSEVPRWRLASDGYWPRVYDVHFHVTPVADQSLADAGVLPRRPAFHLQQGHTGRYTRLLRTESRLEGAQSHSWSWSIRELIDVPVYTALLYIHQILKLDAISWMCRCRYVGIDVVMGE